MGEIAFKPTKAHANADELSRLPLAMSDDPDTTDGAAVFHICQVHSLSVTASQLRRATRQDPIVSAALPYTRQGWPNEVSAELKLYFWCCSELSVVGECLMCGIRVIVPEKLRSKVLDALHETHLGMAKAKSIA